MTGWFRGFLNKSIIKQIGFVNNFMLLENISNDIIVDLVDYFTLLFGFDYLLVKAVKHGILYHHGDFPQFVRKIIEDSISNEGFKLIVCTNTLTEGVNLPIKTIVIHSTKRYNPATKGNCDDLSVRELRNLIGRSGRAGKETSGLIIVLHSDDFQNINNIMTDTNDEKIYGNLYNKIIRPVTKILIERNINFDEKLLADFEKRFPNIIDPIDISLLELLSEEVGSEELMKIVNNLVSNAFSYYQSSGNEKDTLTKIFVHRANALLPYINTNEFKVIKGSGTSLSAYKTINEVFNFENETWFSCSDALSEDWLYYILDNGIFKIDAIKQSLDDFNVRNKTDISFELIKDAIIKWMKGGWYNELADISGISVDIVLELINIVFQLKFQAIISAVIRMAEIKNTDKQISPIILNWTKMFQYGLDSQLKLDLLELGLTDRTAILFMEKYCGSKE
jgi:hypothetical protein